MPFIDVTDLLIDPDFCEQITVKRRSESVNGYGESERVTETHTVTAVVTAGSQPRIDRAAEGQRQPNTITVHTMFKLTGPAVGFQPDVIVFAGRDFVVTTLFDWSHYGAGFVCAECSAMDYQEAPPV